MIIYYYVNGELVSFDTETFKPYGNEIYNPPPANGIVLVEDYGMSVLYGQQDIDKYGFDVVVEAALFYCYNWERDEFSSYQERMTDEFLLDSFNNMPERYIMRLTNGTRGMLDYYPRTFFKKDENGDLVFFSENFSGFPHTGIFHVKDGRRNDYHYVTHKSKKHFGIRFDEELFIEARKKVYADNFPSLREYFSKIIIEVISNCKNVQ